MQERPLFIYPREALHYAITAAARRTEYRQAKDELKGLQILLEILSSRREFDPSIFEELDPLPIDLLLEIEKAKQKKKRCRKAYYKAKNYVRKVLICYWVRRIRFASRAIGNMFDYSLITEPVPPTTVPADEYVMNYSFVVRQQGGASVGSLA